MVSSDAYTSRDLSRVRNMPSGYSRDSIRSKQRGFVNENWRRVTTLARTECTQSNRRADGSVRALSRCMCARDSRDDGALRCSEPIHECGLAYHGSHADSETVPEPVCYRVTLRGRGRSESMPAAAW